MVIISKRLKTIAEKVLPNSKLADIGSDHALLPTYLAQKDRIKHAVAGEVNQGPYEAAKKQVEGANLQSVIQVRLGNGLEVIKQNEIDTIVIAGMGGGLITNILDQPFDYTCVSRLILQPNMAEDKVRQWCLDHHWKLAEEEILEEDGKIYEIIVADRSGNADEENEHLFSEEDILSECQTKVTTKLKIMMGPYLLSNASSIFVKKWNREIDKREKVIQQLSQSHLDEAAKKKKEFITEVNQLKEVIKCLQTDKPSFSS
ncbi:tRNA (adenine(22)-N(1))-methyltransferase [Chengkuizengella axinellae]|uniref:Class I SAM-dependent methyltransferase n=1 Tax=Chengkuizengella axinellae TaxID=3064388 RepID=A0ABT9IUU9_9BACL|nr:class I SAM-dependent methyltransferase [Chengkuizengella sp. 2205SS18-9]MDP5273108.1 class I SAM-dependent methyltransferase [Chengkuizengella sp. 2205SS18-9]